MGPKKRLAIGFAGVCLLLTLSGCAQITVHSTVNSDGIVSDYDMRVNMTRQAYGYFEQSVERDGYDSVEDYFTTYAEGNATENVEFDQDFNGDQVSTHISIDEIDPSRSGTLSVETQDGQLMYEDKMFVNESAQKEPESDFSQSFTSGISVDYYLTMPGKITESNADSVEGKTAEWHESGREAYIDNRISATSKQPLMAQVPGFAGLSAVLALSLCVGFLYYNRKE